MTCALYNIKLLGGIECLATFLLDMLSLAVFRPP